MSENEELDVAENVQSEETEVEEIPQELEGISEDIARETMEEARQLEETKQRETEENQQDSEPKEQNAEVNALKEQLAAYRQRFGDLNAPMPQAQQQQAQQMQQATPPAPRVSADVAKRIKEAINVRAKEISGLTNEDIDSLEYMDDDDERIEQWKSANEMAKNEVYGAIQKAQEEKVQAARAFLEEHQKNVNAFNEYVQKEKENKDFENISNYAVDDKNGYAKNLTEQEKSIIGGAYARTERGVASPQDYYIVRKYYERAKADFYGKRGTNGKTKGNVPKPHPRSENIVGSVDTSGITAEQLETMLNTKKWGEIPKVYQDLMLGAN